MEYNDDEKQNAILIGVKFANENTTSEIGVDIEFIKMHVILEIGDLKSFLLVLCENNLIKKQLITIGLVGKYYFKLTNKGIEFLNAKKLLSLKEIDDLILEKTYDIYKRHNDKIDIQFHSKLISNILGITNFDKVQTAVDNLIYDNMFKKIAARYGDTIYSLNSKGILKMEGDLEMEYNKGIYVINGIAQINSAVGNAVIHATQNNGLNIQELENILKDLQQKIPANITEQEKEEINESIDFIRTEVQNEKPKKSLLKKTLLGLQAVKGTAEFGAAVTALYSFFHSIGLI